MCLFAKGYKIIKGKLYKNIDFAFGPIKSHATGRGGKLSKKKPKALGIDTFPDVIGRDFVRSTCLSIFLSQKSFATQPAALSIKLAENAQPNQPI